LASFWFDFSVEALRCSYHSAGSEALRHFEFMGPFCFAVTRVCI